MLAVRIKKQLAEEARKRLLKAGCLDKRRLILQRGEFVEIPILQSLKGFEIVEQEKPKFKKANLSFERLKELLKTELIGTEADALKGGWELIGDILIITIPAVLEDKKYILGRKLLELFPKVKTVLNRKGIQNEFREPRCEILAGNETETIHRENHCLFKLNPLKVMFSAGNIQERRRIAFISNEKEVVLDMFAGIGQFSIPVAKHSKPEKVFSIEKNPVAFRYLQENINLNKLNNIEPILGDCREVAPKNVADRVIMGYFFNPKKFLPTAVEALRSRGVIQYHDLVFSSLIDKKVEEIRQELKKLRFDSKLLEKRFIKSYAPKKWHVVFDFLLKKI